MKVEKAMKVKEAIEAIPDLNIKVSVVAFGNGQARVNIRDFEFEDSIKAEIYIHHIGMIELPDNYRHLVG